MRKVTRSEHEALIEKWPIYAFNIAKRFYFVFI